MTPRGVKLVKLAVLRFMFKLTQDLGTKLGSNWLVAS